MKFNINEMIRPCCKSFQPYVAGKPVETIKRELGLKKVIKLASNENPLGPSKHALSAIKKEAGNVYFYPDSNSYLLRKALADKFKVKSGNVILGAGSDEIIELIAKAFFLQSDEIIVSEHAFIRYKMAGDLMGCKVVSIPMKDFKHNLSAMADAVTPNTKAIFIANPNNPTGTYNTADEVETLLTRLLAYSPTRLPLVIIDEAYYEYATASAKDYPQTLKYLSKNPNLIILRTFSKIYGLAGLRVGYGFANPQIIDYLDRIRPPFNINSIGQSAALASLKDKTQVKKGIELVNKEKEYLYRELKSLGVPFIPSAGNFILIEVKPFSGAEISQKLLKLGIIVRAMDEYEFPGHIRVAIGLPEENRLFISSFKKLMERSC